MSGGIKSGLENVDLRTDQLRRDSSEDGASLTKALAAAEKPLSGDFIDVNPVMTRPIAKINTIARMMSGLRFIAKGPDASMSKMIEISEIMHTPTIWSKTITQLGFYNF